jgi:hypothetical protein
MMMKKAALGKQESGMAILWIVMTTMLLILGGCSNPSGNDDDKTPTVSSVSVSPATVSIAKGGTETFAATVTGTNNPAQTVAWTVEGTTNTGTAITNAGVLTVAADEAAETLTVKATSTFDTSKSGTATVTVVVPTVNSVVVSPATTSIAKGRNGTFAVTVTGTNSPAQTVAWTVEGTTNTGTTITNAGVLTVAADEAAETLTVRATSTFDTSKSGTATVTVVVPTVSSVVVSPATVSIAKGGSRTFAATVEGTYSPAQTVAWTVEGTTNTGTAITAAGVLTVAADETAETLTVRATSTFDTGKSGTAAVMIVEFGTPTVSVQFSGLPEDETITLTGPDSTLSFSANTTITVSVAETFDTYRWALDGEVLSGETDYTLTRNAKSLLIKNHSLTVYVTTSDGVEYSKRVSFIVNP